MCVRVHFGSEQSWQCACQLINRLENKCVFSKWAHAKVRVFPDYLAVCGGTRLTTRDYTESAIIIFIITPSCFLFRWYSDVVAKPCNYNVMDGTGTLKNFPVSFHGERSGPFASRVCLPVLSHSPAVYRRFIVKGEKESIPALDAAKPHRLTEVTVSQKNKPFMLKHQLNPD